MTKARDIASAAPAPSTVSATELGYVDGVTSAIQTQLDAKTAKSTLTTTGDIYYASAANTPARLGIGSSAQVLTVAGGIPSWAAPAAGGKVLQVVSTQITSVLSATSSGTVRTFTDASGFSATITPTSATSKIMILAQISIAPTSVQGNARLYLKLLRNSTDISVGDSATGVQCSASFFTNSSVGYHSNNTPINWLDSPATTSATTYKFQFAANQASQTVVFNRGEGTPAADTGLVASQIILMEIGA
jgi:hypothetical protein